MSVSTSHLFQILARICTCLMETEPGITISTLLNVKGGLENHLLQVRKEKKKSGWWLSACLPWWLAHTDAHAHTHTHTLSLAPKRSHQAGMSAVFTYRGGAHLIEGLIFMASTNRTLTLPPQNRMWLNTHGESTIWHTYFRFLSTRFLYCGGFLSFHGCPPFCNPV